MFADNTIYIVGESKTTTNNAITQQYNGFFIALVVNRDTGEILDAECTSTIDITSNFVKAMLTSKNMKDLDLVLEQIESRYFGSSQKALMVAFKNANIKYMQITNV
ncbi:DUF3870 domain-containing protein [Cytobacillus gottheilii]|uniref:DUF3870 domain-containing protein n=1 Tax=Cytobacillus gottheilii TaxID=859144 RepID=UPI0009BC31DE|nr:DUF3870 domain-containing protein [Cytobacillus gottheilii]